MVGEGVARVKGVAALIGQPSGQPPNSSREKGLQRVDPVKAYPLAVHFNGIAVDHGGGPGHVGKGRGGEQAQGDGDGAHECSLPHPAAQARRSRPGKTE